jgi:alginate O-acetyltransferase complex protein AlgI
MLFNSYEFIFVFLPISFFVYFYLNNKRLTTASKSWLVFTSLFFYSWWNVVYLPLILVSILFNYAITNTMLEYDDSKKKYFSKKSLLQIGLLFNVGLLVYFKYMDFFISNTNSVLGSDIGLLHLALPLAISFFTLQQIAYLIDSYEGLVKEKNFLDYTIFVTFFPQLIAGPIVHHKEMMPQFASAKNKVKNYNNIALGVFIFSIGLFKKVVIADTFAVWATAGFDTATTLNLFEAWATSISYTFQLYFDFSGYTDMAIGAALLFNIKLPQNFNSPYKATGMIDFWQRWHITLSSFITTYIYTPIVRSFKKLTFHKAMFATFLTFFIAGLWHGASWMFIIFGSLHGIGLVVNQYWKKATKKAKIKTNKVLAWFITFNFVNITFIFFRAKEWDDAIKVLSSMFSLDNIVLPEIAENSLIFLTQYGVSFSSYYLTNINGSKQTIIAIAFGFLVVLLFKSSKELLSSFKPSVFNIIMISALLAFGIMNISKFSEFLYFNF